jgi:hypothetical protein
MDLDIGPMLVQQQQMALSYIGFRYQARICSDNYVGFRLRACTNFYEIPRTESFSPNQYAGHEKASIDSTLQSDSQDTKRKALPA